MVGASPEEHRPAGRTPGQRGLCERVRVCVCGCWTLVVLPDTSSIPMCRSWTVGSFVMQSRSMSIWDDGDTPRGAGSKDVWIAR